MYIWTSDLYKYFAKELKEIGIHLTEKLLNSLYTRTCLVLWNFNYSNESSDVLWQISLSSLRIDRPPIKSVFDLSCPYKNKLHFSSYYRLVKGLDKFRFNNIRVRRLNSNYGSMWREIIMFSIKVIVTYWVNVFTNWK